MADERECVFCGAKEEDSNLVNCHSCGKVICVDNCVESNNGEHGLSYCGECVNREELDAAIADAKGGA